jgi:hypothetical protein
MNEMFGSLKEFFFNAFVLVFFILGAAHMVIHDLGRLRRAWKVEMSKQADNRADQE